MPDLKTFTKFNLMAGTARGFEQTPLSSEDQATFDRDYDLIVSDISSLVDPTIGQDLAQQKEFYQGACQIAKGYFNKKPFGGLKAATGQFGFRFLEPQDLKQAASALTPAYYSWVQSLTTTSAKTYATYALGYASGNVFTSSVINQQSVLAFHRLLSYRPAPRLMYVEWWVNSVPYVPYSVEPFSKVATQVSKLHKIVPMPGKIILNPGAGFYCHFWFDLLGGATAPSGTTTIDVEVGLLGLVFAEYDYLKAASGT